MRDVEVLLGHRRRLPTSVEVVLGTMDVPKAVELGLDAIGGDLAVDGSIGARTAALDGAVRRPRRGGRSSRSTTRSSRGSSTTGTGPGCRWACMRSGTGRSNRCSRAWESVHHRLDSRERRHFRARRHRIEHFEMPTAEQIERAAMLGIAVSMQPTFDLEWGHPGGLYEQAVGAARAFAMNPVRTAARPRRGRGGRLRCPRGADRPLADGPRAGAPSRRGPASDPSRARSGCTPPAAHGSRIKRRRRARSSRGCTRTSRPTTSTRWRSPDVRDAPTDHDRVSRPRGVARLMSFLSHFLRGPA